MAKGAWQRLEWTSIDISNIRPLMRKTYLTLSHHVLTKLTIEVWSPSESVCCTVFEHLGIWCWLVSLLCNEMCPHHFPASSLPLRLVMRMTKERKGRGWVRPMNLFPSYLPFISLSAPGSPRSGPKWRSPEKNGCFVILFLVQSNSKQNILWMKLRVGSNNLNNLLDFDRSFTCFFFLHFVGLDVKVSS